MKLTPLDVKQKRFEKSFRGYAPEEVEEFLLLVAEDLEEAARETGELKDELHRLNKVNNELAQREQNLQETLLTAKQVASDVKETAEREARVIISNAELEGERLIDQAVRRRERIVNELHDLKRQKAQFESTLRSALTLHLKMLDALEERERELNEEPDISHLTHHPASEYNLPEDPPDREEATLDLDNALSSEAEPESNA